MRKVVLILFMLISINSYCQKKDTVSGKADTLYYIVLKKQQFQNLINAIRGLDEKPSIINAWLKENIYNNTQLVLPPKDKVKK